MTRLVEYINTQQSLANRGRQGQGPMFNRWLRERKSLYDTRQRLIRVIDRQPSYSFL